MNEGLYHLRPSRNCQHFTERHLEYERKCFQTGELPLWYKLLYRSDADTQIDFYNWGQLEVRPFFLKGRGYSESSNSDDRRLINQRRVVMNLVSG